MEIVPMTLPHAGDAHTVGLPFNRRNVEEWSRRDKITGMMEKAKIETDRWSASNSLAAHNYGKVVDSRERNLPDGSLQQRHRKQTEIFQSSVPGGSMQVIRTQTVTTSSSSSQWSSSIKPFDELQLPVNHLDLSSQKTKGSVGRSGSIGTRRPPSRPRSLAGSHGDTLNDVAERCRQLHEEAKARMFRGFTNGLDSERPESPGGVVITELDSPSETSSDRKPSLSRQKSCSNENINEETEENNSIRRTSRFRRSLQFPKTSITDDIPDWTNGKSLKERAAEIENLLRCGSIINYEGSKDEDTEITEKPAKVKSSFVTAETLKEVRERLRKSSDSDMKDEGIVTEIPRVKDVVSGMEAKISQKPLVNGTGSLDLRKNQVNHTSEWYRRRKSYGFEDVDDSDKIALTNGDSSPSSGYTSSFSKTESPFKRYIEEQSFSDAAWNRKSPLPNRERSSLRCTKNPWISQLRGTKLVDRQWCSDTPDPEQNDSGVPDSPKEKDDDYRTFDFDLNKEKKHKKVEFCKTEVHFAPDSGRVNIVETDGKPPNSVVRRRRRNSGTYISSESVTNTSGLPEFKFGDSPFEKKLLTTSNTTSAEKIESLSKKIESELQELSKIVVETIPKEEPSKPAQSLPKLYDVDEEQTDLNDGLRPRSILKPIKKTLNETEDEAPLWKSTVILRNKRFEDVRRNVEERKSYSSDGESELQTRFRNLKKPDVVEPPEVKVEPITVEIKRRSLPDDVLLSVGLRNALKTPGEDVPRLSVAERIKQVEEFKRLKSSYSSKIDFRSGEMTVLQNGTADDEKDAKVDSSSNWSGVKRGVDRSSFSSDVKTASNPSVRRFPTTDPSNTTTTRISINIPFEKPTEKSRNNSTNKPYRSWSFGANCRLQSTSLVMETMQGSEILKPAKPVHEIINKFDSLSRTNRSRDPLRRRTMPINYKAPKEVKEYTHADLEEDLKNFNEDLDRDFKNIYEEEIGSLKGSCKDLKSAFEKVCEAIEPKECSKYKTLPLANGVKNATKVSGFHKYNKLTNGCVNSSSWSAYGSHSLPSGSRLNRQASKNYDSDDSDLLADEEVRSYMSTGQGDSDSEEEVPFEGRKKCFQRIRLQFKKMEETNTTHSKDVKIQASSTPIKPTLVDLTKASEPHYAAPPKVASIALRYEDDPLFKNSPYKTRETDQWEKTSNSSSTMSDNRPRERVSYLNGPSLSEKYSRRTSNCSLDNIHEAGALSRVREIRDTLRSSFRSEGSAAPSSLSTMRLKDYKKHEENVKTVMDPVSTLDELSRAANEILVAVNGMTDDESLLGSSEDEDVGRRVIKKGKVTNLTTISEGKKITNGTTPTDSSKKIVREKSLSSRATRLLQRASNREAMIAQISSSEDIPANVEPVKKKLVRKPRPVTAKKEEKEEKVYSKSKTRVKKEETTCVIHREREKTVSSAAKEVKRTSSKTCQLPTESRTIEPTKPSQRRELLCQADAAAEQSVRRKRAPLANTTKSTREETTVTKRRAPKVSLRKVEATRVSQAV